MGWFKPHNVQDRAYLAGLVLKGLDGILELIGAGLLLVISPQTINQAIIDLTQYELSRDPRDALSHYLLHAGQMLTTGGTTFAVAYLFVHGITKVVLVAALLRDKLWAYPVSLVVLWLFILYQVYQIGLERSVWLVLLTLFDLVVVWLIWREWQQRRTKVAD